MVASLDDFLLEMLDYSVTFPQPKVVCVGGRVLQGKVSQGGVES